MDFHEPPTMRLIVPAVLILVAAIHLLPLIGVVRAVRLESLYGIRIADASTELLLRHRAVLFGLLGVFLGVTAFRPSLYTAGLAAGLVSVASFLLLAWSTRDYASAIATVVRVDLLALVLLAIGAAAHLVTVRST